jgi:hypothetical protein
MVRCTYPDGDEEECINVAQTEYTYNDLNLETERINSDRDEEAE